MNGSPLSLPLAPNRRGRRSGRSKGDVLEVASRVVAERGADATRFADVSRASDVPVSTLQYYFGNRDDLLLATFRHVCGREILALSAAVNSSDDPWRQLVALVHVGVADGARSMETWRTWVEFWRGAIRDDELRLEAHAIYARWRELIGEVVRRGVVTGRFKNVGNVEYLCFQLIALIDGIGVPVALADPGLPAQTSAPINMVIDALARLVGLQLLEPS